MASGKAKKAKKTPRKKKVARAIDDPSGPTPGTTIILRPGASNSLNWLVDGQSAVLDAPSGVLPADVFTQVMWMNADVNINGTVYQGVNCRRARLQLMINGVPRWFQFEAVGTEATWYLDDVEFLADATVYKPHLSADLAGPLASAGALAATVRVQLAGQNPDWQDYPFTQVLIAFV